MWLCILCGTLGCKVDIHIDQEPISKSDNMTNHKLSGRLESVGMRHDHVIKWKHLPCYWLFARRIHRSRWIPLTKASDAELWCFLICAWINEWVNNREAGDLRRHRAHYDVNVMVLKYSYGLEMWQAARQQYCNVVCTNIEPECPRMTHTIDSQNIAEPHI